MENFQCIAVDMGASSIRILVGEAGSGQIHYTEIYRFKNEIRKENNSDRWDINLIYSGISEGVTMALKKYPKLQSIGVESWGVDYVLLDGDGKYIEKPFAYRDSRTEGMQEEWNSIMSKEETFRKTGINFYIFNTLFQLLSAKNSEALQAAKQILFIPNYIYYRLTGISRNELTISSTSQMLKVENSEFDEDILSKLDLSPEIFGKVIEPGEPLGPVNDPSLPENSLTAVSVCSHDTAAAVAAIPFADNYSAFISTGTWCILGFESEKPLLSEKALSDGYTNERGFGNSYRVLKNIIGLWLVQGLKKDSPEIEDFSDLEKMAENMEYTGHIIDPEDESFFNPNSMKLAFDSFFERTGQTKPESIAQYVLCAYNSLGMVFSRSLKQLEEISGLEFANLHMIGGGSKSKLFCQATADLTGKKVIAGPAECSALGNIMIQAIGMKKLRNISEGREWIRQSTELKSYTPNISETEREKLFQKLIKI